MIFLNGRFFRAGSGIRTCEIVQKEVERLLAFTLYGSRRNVFDLFPRKNKPFPHCAAGKSITFQKKKKNTNCMVQVAKESCIRKRYLYKNKMCVI